jgi:AraC family transcriptional regulator of adaptative response/methylated-DNA-[protein]-cysteine methyltransferase
MAILSNNSPQPHRNAVQLRTFNSDDSNARNAVSSINYAIGDSPFGDFFIATTNVGICQLEFLGNNDLNKQLENAVRIWPNAKLINKPPPQLSIIKGIFEHRQPCNNPLALHVMGTEFQIQVWRALLEINSGCHSSYADIAKRIGKPQAARAVGGAIGANPIALLIPCHRVVRHNGDIGGYRWGISRKRVLLKWESTGQI